MRCEKFLVTVVPEEPGDKIVFATSERYTGDVPAPDCTDCTTGLDRADFERNRLAGLEGLSGTFVAWLSTTGAGGVDAVDRLADAGADGPWFNLNPAGGEQISATRAGLTDGAIDNPVRYDETGADPAGIPVWTGTDVDGTAGPNTCDNWASSLNTDQGTEGAKYGLGRTWTRLSSTPDNDK